MPAEYFSNFPMVTYTLNQSPKAGEFTYVTDIFRRVAPIADFTKDRRIFYTYHIQEGDSPEIVADRQYGSPKYHWVVCLFNNITDPLLEWPRSYANMVTYIIDKYGSLATALTTVHHYTMTVTKTNSNAESSSVTTTIDATKYATLASVVPVVYTFANGGTVTVSTTRASVTTYDYEMDLNEQKRTIILLRPAYLPQVLKELERLAAV